MATIIGQLVSTRTEFNSSFTTSTETILRNGSRTIVGDTRREREIATYTRADGQYCVHHIIDVIPIPSGPPSHQDITSCFTLGSQNDFFFRILANSGESSTTREFLSAPPGPTQVVRTIERSYGTNSNNLTVVGEFGLPEGATLKEVRIETGDFFAYQPVSTYQFNGVSPVLTPDRFSSSNCAEEIAGRNARWSILGPTLDANNRFQFMQPDVAPVCPSVLNGTTVTQTSNPTVRTTTVINQVASDFDSSGSLRADIATFPLTLLLTPNEPIVVPTNVKGFSTEESTRTMLHVGVTGGEPQASHEVVVRIDGFDALAGGHRHDNGVPPADKRPTLEGEAQTSCAVTMDDSVPPVGSCDLEFIVGDFGRRSARR